MTRAAFDLAHPIDAQGVETFRVRDATGRPLAAEELPVAAEKPALPRKPRVAEVGTLGIFNPTASRIATVQAGAAEAGRSSCREPLQVLASAEGPVVRR